jgi:phosphoribosylamine--glycine ligase
VLIEEFLEGQEVSVHALTDGCSYRLLPAAQDHKRVGEGDTGPNTGGMGAYAPAPTYTSTIDLATRQTIIEPVLQALAQEGIDYRGVLYAGLMLTAQGPKVLEFNVRFGDPETQVLLPLLQTSLVDVALAVHGQKLDQCPFSISDGAALGVVLAAANYPSEPQVGDVIHFPEVLPQDAGCIFHSGTKTKEGRCVTAGGRVLTATAWGSNLKEASRRAYALTSQLSFSGMHFRKDIGRRALGSC